MLSDPGPAEKLQGEAFRAGEAGRVGKILRGLENGLCFFSLLSLVVLPLSEIIAKFIFNTGVPDSSGIMINMLLLSGMFAGMITTRNGEHLSIALAQYFSDEGIKRKLGICTNLLSAFVVTVIAWTSPAFIRIGLSDRFIGPLPERVYALSLPIGYGVTAFRFARRTGFSGWKRIFPALAILLGTAAAWPGIAKFIWVFDLPPWAEGLTGLCYDIAWHIRIPGIALLIAAALAGTPLFVIMGGLVILLFETSGNQIDAVSTFIHAALTNDSIIAIPLFTLVGFFLSESRAGERLVLSFRSFFGWLPGGMIIATVIICAFFTSFTGASGVTILALGGILYTILAEHVKYPEKFSIGLLTSVGSVGLMFPPSLPLILVGVIGQTNIFHMFAGGLLPGLILVAAVIVFGIIASVRKKIPLEPFRPGKALGSLKGTILEIILPFILVTAYFTGILSPTEIGAVAVFYVFITEVLVHRDIKFTKLPHVFLKAVPIIGGVLAILALSQALSYYIIDTNVPSDLAEWMLETVQSKYVFLLLLNLALLVVGCLMDIFSAILIILPLITPLGAVYGIDPVHLGIIFVINLEVGFLTPPVGLNLFLAAYRFKKPFVDICRYVFPFLLIQFVVVLLVTYVPAL
ncbi:MAG: TRAP transporter large permease subunit, partial [Treponema sp.]|nr:TRAP transporter large permease subunit [Treponema sp.]